MDESLIKQRNFIGLIAIGDGGEEYYENENPIWFFMGRTAFDHHVKFSRFSLIFQCPI
jgi:hypothetical protein